MTVTGVATLGELLFHVSPYDIDDLIFGHKYSPDNPRYACPLENNQLEKFSTFPEDIQTINNRKI
jgi:hypothetical protein